MPGMPPRSRLRELGRATLGRVPGPVRSRVLGAVGGRMGLEGAEIGLVSVVVVPEEGDRVEECLASVRGQTHALLDVVVSPVGAEPRSELPDDPRFRTSAPRRRRTTRCERGSRPPPVATSCCCAAATCSSRTPCRPRRIAGRERLRPRHRRARAARRGRALAGSRPGRRPRRARLGAGPPAPRRRRPVPGQQGVHPRPRPPPPAGRRRRLALLALLARLLPGLTVDVVDRPVARYAWERGHRAYGARPSPLPELDRWRDLHHAVRRCGRGHRSDDGWLRHWYDVLLPRFVADAERADEATWKRLVALSAVPRASTSAPRRGACWPGRRRAAYRCRGPGRRARPPRRRPSDRAHRRRTAGGWASVDLPADLRRLSATETRLRSGSCASARPPTGADVDLWTRVEGVDLARHPVALTFEADGVDALQPGVDRTAERWAGRGSSRRRRGRPRGPPRPGRVRCGSTSGRSAGRPTYLAPPPARRPAGPEPVVQGIALDGDRLVVQLDRPADGLRLRGPGTDVPGEPSADGTVVFDTRRDLYGRQVALPTAVYHLHRPGGLAAAPGASGCRSRSSAPAIACGCSPPATGRASCTSDRRGPTTSSAPTARSGCDRRTPSTTGRPTLTSGTSRASPAARRRTRPWPSSRSCGAAGRGSCRSGGSSTTATGRRRTSRPVVIGSREWYDVLGTARVLVTNTELEEWYRRRPDQLVVQCFHGYPSKAMGRSQWAARELPPRRVAVMRRRSVETWDLISTPTPEMTEVYREQYGYTGPAAEHGYPRNDALRRSDADAVRATRPGGSSAYARTRRRCSTPPPGATTSPYGRERRRCRSTSTWTPRPRRWATRTCSCCAVTASTPRARRARVSST